MVLIAFAWKACRIAVSEIQRRIRLSCHATASSPYHNLDAPIDDLECKKIDVIMILNSLGKGYMCSWRLDNKFEE